MSERSRRDFLKGTAWMGAMALAAGVAFASPNRVVYFNDFNHLADCTPAFRPGTRVHEYGTGSLKSLRFAPEAEGLAHERYFRISEAPEGKWTFSFVARNMAKDAVRSEFELLLYYGDAENPKTEAHALSAEEPWFVRKHVYSAGDGRLVGWNLRGRPGCDVIIDFVRVEQGVHRPYRLGDPEEWLAKLPPVEDEQLPADFGRAMEAKTAYPVDLEKEDLLFKFKPGARPETLAFRTDGGERKLDFRLGDEQVRMPDRTWMTLTNAYLKISPARVPYFPYVYSRPRLGNRYQLGEQAEILAALGRFPTPTNKVHDLRITRNDRGENELWVNGNLALLFTNAPVRSVTGSSAFRMDRAPRPAPSLVQKLDFRAWPDGFPLWMVRENRGGCWLGVLDYCCRSCFEAMPSSCLFSVPNRPYVKARALCRVATDVPVDFEPVVVARLTSYFKQSWGDAGGRSAAACAKAEVRLPRPGSGDPLPAGVERKGENLYLVTFDLPVGDMQDLLYRPDPQAKKNDSPVDQLDFEFTGVLWRQDCSYVDRSSVPDSEVQSSVVVLSGELEAAPCDFDVVPRQPCSTYYPHETPGGRATIRPRLPGKYEIAWTVSDDDGRVLERGTASASGEIEFATREVGHYNVAYDFRGNGRTLWTHEGSYVVVPEDDRVAGYDSPYFSWLWSGTHGTCSDRGLAMEMMQRCGVKETMLDRYAKLTEGDELCARYGIYQGQFTFSRHRVRPRPGETMDQAIERQAKDNREHAKKYPHTKRAMIFHESGYGPFPWELVGGKTVLTEEDRKKDRELFDVAVATAKAWRKADPSVKLVVGNSVEGYGLLARLFRNGYPRDLIDFVGEETVGMSSPPETTTALVPWMQQELARVFGYEGIRSDCPFEWKCRTPRLFSDPDYLVPAFHIRDCLIAHALGYRLIPSGAECGGGSDGYSQSVWSGSAKGRWPLAYPGRGGLASSVMTSVLDCAKFLRLVPTGSLGVYCEEFAVKGRYVYALWTTRGETDVALDLGENAEYETVSLTGRRAKGVKDRAIVVADEPRYLIAAKPLKGAKAALQRRYPREEIAFAKRAVAVQLRSADEVEPIEREDGRLYCTSKTPFRRPGPFAAKTADDPLKGACVELTDLSGTEKTPKPVANLTFLRVTKPVAVEGEYDSIGVWVEGNAAWGKVWFEFADAEGEVWLTNGSGGYGGEEYDWPGNVSINFDGWHFVKFPLTAASPIKVGTPGENEEQLTNDARGNGRIDFPVKVTGLAVSNHPWGLDFLEMRPTRPYVRIKDVTLLRQ